MRVPISRRIAVEIAGLCVVAAMLVLLHWVQHRDRIAVSFELSSSADAVAKLFWGEVGGFDEQRQVQFALQGGQEPQRYLTADIPVSAFIRLDPVNQPSRFYLSDLSLHFRDSPLPWVGRNRATVPLAAAVGWTQVEAGTAPHHFVASGVDPQLVFRLALDPSERRRPLVLAGLVLAVGLVAGVFLARALVARVASGSAPRTLTLAEIALLAGIYGVYALAVILLRAFVDLAPYSGAMVYATVGVFWLYGALSGWGRSAPGMAASILVGTAVFAAMGHDVLFRLGVIERATFSRAETPSYHWRIDRSPADNYQNSSLRYYDDFDKLANILPADSLVLADRVTGYYLTAALPVFSANPSPHHRIATMRAELTNVSDEFVEALCGREEGLGGQTPREYLERKRRYHRKYGWPELRYVVVNKDDVNRNVRLHCLSRHGDVVARQIAGFSRKIFEGEFLDVYEIDLDAPPPPGGGAPAQRYDAATRLPEEYVLITSDTHLSVDRGRWPWTTRSFRSLVERLARHPPELVFIAGDVIDNYDGRHAGDLEYWNEEIAIYEELRARLGAERFHQSYGPGHDYNDAAALERLEARLGPAAGKVTWRGIDFIWVSFSQAVFVDGAERHANVLDDAGYRQLRDMLDGAERAVLLFHVPLRTQDTFAAGKWSDGTNLTLDPRDPLYAIIDEHRDRLLAVFNGHVHRRLQSRYNGIPVYVCPFYVEGSFCTLSLREGEVEIGMYRSG